MNPFVLLMDGMKIFSSITWIQIRYNSSTKHGDKLIGARYFAEEIVLGKNGTVKFGTFFVLFSASNV